MEVENWILLMLYVSSKLNYTIPDNKKGNNYIYSIVLTAFSSLRIAS